MARIINTIPDFHAFAGRALDADEDEREQLWERRYRDANSEIFDAFFAGYGERDGLAKVLSQLAGVRRRVQAASSQMPDIIEDVEPDVRQLLDAHDQSEPIHVLLVGTMSANAFVAPLGDQLAVFHCLEWFADARSAKVLVAHEDAHAWHRRLLGDHPDEDDAAWMAFYEGLAVQASRQVVPERLEDDYFWYGVAGFEDWLDWCREHRTLLLGHFREALSGDKAVGRDAGDPVEVFFGAGFVEGRWRTGFFIADELVASLDTELSELARWDVDEARRAILDQLDG